MTFAKKFSYALFGVFVVAAVVLRLGPVILAGLFSFMILDLTHRRLATLMPEFLARWLSVLVFLITAVCVSWMLIAFLKLALARTPLILASLIPQIDGLASSYGVNLPFENLHEMRVVIIDTIKENARSVTQVSGLVTREFFQVVVGIFVAILCFLSAPAPADKPNFFDAVRREFDVRVAIFMQGFEKILGAQVLISVINTAITLVFLLVMGLPYVHFLALATFILGVIPIIGSVASNTIIVGTALTVSPRLALISFGFLVVSHKAQYFLNSRIIGARINTPMWQLLLGLLIGEGIMGLPGMILAPAMLHYVREEMLALPYEREGRTSRS